MARVKYFVAREHHGDIEYSRGDERMAEASDVAHLVKLGVLAEWDDALHGKDAGGAPKNKAGGKAPKNKKASFETPASPAPQDEGHAGAAADEAKAAAEEAARLKALDKGGGE